jgi:plasmid stability protein
MPGLVIKNVPVELHTRLKEAAKRNHRSMTQQVLAILEQTLDAEPLDFPRPLKGKRALTQSRLTRAIRQGRA